MSSEERHSMTLSWAIFPASHWCIHCWSIRMAGSKYTINFPTDEDAPYSCLTSHISLHAMVKNLCMATYAIKSTDAPTMWTVSVTPCFIWKNLRASHHQWQAKCPHCIWIARAAFFISLHVSPWCINMPLTKVKTPNRLRNMDISSNANSESLLKYPFPN